MRKGLVLLSVLLALALGGCGSEEPTLHGQPLDRPYVVPATSLTDTDGQPFSLAADTDKRLTLVFFGYTHCPDICQVVMANIASGLTKLDSADRDQVEVVFVTTDPARDTETVLREYLDRFDPSFIGLTGSMPTIIDVGKALAVAVEHGEKLPSGGYEVAHGTAVIGIDASDKAPIIWTQPTSAADFANDIHHLLAE